MDTKISINSQWDNGFYLVQFKTTDLSIFSYYVESQGKSIIIDPTFDTVIYKELIQRRKSQLQFVCMTHYHADFLSGHTDFQVPIIMGEKSVNQECQFKITEYADQQKFKLGALEITVIHTPGHTPESSCYLLTNSDHKDICIFTGDTVFLGDLGRPDLATSKDVTKEDMAQLMFESIKKIKKLDPQIRIYPAHGAGSPCGKAIGAGNFCTLEKQLQTNFGLLIQQKEQFIKAMTSNISQPPKYFFHDVSLNKRGVTSSYSQLFQKAKKAFSLEQFEKNVQEYPIIDTRNNLDQGLIKGSYWIPSKGGMSTWLTMVLQPQQQFILICNEGQTDEIINRILRVGYFGIRGYNGFNINDYKIETISPVIVDGKSVLERKERQHIDVRNKPQWQNTGIIQNSILIPLPQMKQRVQQLSGKKNLVVSCRSGLRACFAWSIMQKVGIQAIILSDLFDKLAQKGLPIVQYKS